MTIFSLSLLMLMLPAARSRVDQLRTQRTSQDSTPIAITHVTVIDVVNGRRIANRTVVVRGNRILSVANGRAVPHAGTRVVDGRGKFLIPGLWDMRAHAVRDTPNTLPLFVANGITGLRDMGDDLDSTMAAAARDRDWSRASRAEEGQWEPPASDRSPTCSLHSRQLFRARCRGAGTVA